MSSSGKVISLLGQITVEPVVLLSWLGLFAYQPVYTQLFLGATCRQVLHFSEQVCSHLQDPENREKAQLVQAEWAKWNAYVPTVNSSLVIIFSVVVAAWSDRYGRKVALCLPLVGATLASFVLLTNNYIPGLPIWQLLLVPMLTAFGGGGFGLMASAMAYMADSTSRGAERTTRFSIVFACFLFGFSAGSMIGSLLLQWWPNGGGQAATFYLYLATSLLSIAYIVVRLPETVVSDAPLGEKVRAFFSPRAFVDLWSTMSSGRHVEGGSGRRRLWMLLSAVGVYFLITGGEFSIFQPYMEMPPFNWSLPYYMSILSYYGFADVAITFLFIPFVKHILKWGDISLGVIGVLSELGQGVTLFLTQSSTVILFAWGVGQLNMTPPVAIRALLSRVVADDEQARAFALFAIAENALPTIGSLLYAWVLGWSAHLWPALPFGMSALLCVFPLAILLWIDVEIRRGFLVGDTSAD